jgi:hypothetical protein
MKNLLKFGFLALALTLSVAACNSEKKAEGADTTAMDTTAVAADTTAAAADTTKAAADTTKAAAPAAAH